MYEGMYPKEKFGIKPLKSPFQAGVIEEKHKSSVRRALDRLAVVADYVEVRNGFGDAFWTLAVGLWGKGVFARRPTVTESRTVITSTRRDP